MSAGEEKNVANMITAAIVCAASGALLAFFVMPIGLRIMGESGTLSFGLILFLIPPLLFLTGIVLAAIGLAMGFNAGKASSKTERFQHVQVRSRFAVNEIGEMIFSNFEHDAPGGELYVQIMFPDGVVRELRTAWGVFNACGEGLWGAAVVEKDWLVTFVPEIAAPGIGAAHLPEQYRNR